MRIKILLTGSSGYIASCFNSLYQSRFSIYCLDKKKPKFKSGLYFIGTRHIQFKKFKFPKGSTVIDPFRYIPKNTKINLISLGKN